MFFYVIVFLADAVDTWPSHDWLCDFNCGCDCWCERLSGYRGTMLIPKWPKTVFSGNLISLLLFFSSMSHLLHFRHNAVCALTWLSGCFEQICSFSDRLDLVLFQSFYLRHPVVVQSERCISLYVCVSTVRIATNFSKEILKHITWNAFSIQHNILDIVITCSYVLD